MTQLKKPECEQKRKEFFQFPFSATKKKNRGNLVPFFYISPNIIYNAVGGGPVRIYPPRGDIQVPVLLHGVSEEAAPGARGERGEPGDVRVSRPGHAPRHPALPAGQQGEDARQVRGGGGGGERGGSTSYQPAGSCTRHGLCPGLSCHADIHIKGPPSPSHSPSSSSSSSSSPSSPSSSPNAAGKCPT